MAKKGTEKHPGKPPRKGKRSFLRNLVIERISFVGDEKRVVLFERRKHQRGARPKLTVYDYLDDLAAHPDDSVRKRAIRLRVDRQTIRRLEKERNATTIIERRGPILLVR